MKKKIYLPALLVLIAGVLGVGFYYSTINPKTAKKNSTEEEVSQKIEAIVGDSKDTQGQGGYIFSGKVRLLTDKLGLFVFTESEKASGIDESMVKYYEAGEYAEGNYKGYKRIIALRPSIGMGPSVQPFTFATKDFKSYIFDFDASAIDNQDNTWLTDELNKGKVTKNAVLDKEHTNEITIDDKFVLVQNPEFLQNNVITEQKETGKIDENGYKNTEDVLKTDFSSETKLKSSVGNLAFYSKETAPYPKETIDGMNAEDRANYDLRQKYLGDRTQVMVVDSTGLGIYYTLTTKQAAGKYKEDVKNYLEKYAVYKKENEDATVKRNLEMAKGITDEAKLTPLPDSPVYPVRPNLRFTKDDTDITNLFFKNYNSSFSSGCGATPSTETINVNENELEKIGKLKDSGIELFKFKDNNHIINKLAYTFQLGWPPENTYLEIKKFKIPTQEEYLKNIPLLIMKDPWGRFAALQETDDQFVMGCGKPVVYLYPPKPTEVKVQLLTEVKFNTDIPKYNNGWDVLAQSDGSLKDLQTKFTDCEKINANKKGSQYARSACRINNYPYLYWAGQVYGMEYPKPTDGWVVKNSNLSAFFNQKLDEIGFNANEKKDFLDYWLSELQAKNGKYYKISFLQNRELNSLIPMSINPKPDSIYRYFMDYDVLTKPISIAPQKLEKIKRNGFTVVEWGGVKK